MSNATLSLLGEFWMFLGARKKWWLAPILLMLILLGALIFFAQASALSTPPAQPIQMVSISSLSRCPRKGTAWSRAIVYGCCGVAKICALGPASTISPLRITAI